MAYVNYYTGSFYAMGTRCDAVLIHADTGFAERIFHSIQKETLHLELLLSRFREDSPVFCFNGMAEGEKFQPGEDLWEIILQCRDFYRLSGGIFDITAGPLIRLLKEKSIPFSPSSAEIDAARNSCGFENIFLNEENLTMEKLKSGVELDFGAVGKGLALDKIKVLLNKAGIHSAFISFGESSLLGLGKHPAGDYWPVGIPNPVDPAEILHNFRVTDHCVTSSGTILNGGNPGQFRRSHIIDPIAGKPIGSLTQVSVMSTSAVYGEFLSTVALMMSPGDICEVKKQLGDAEIIRVDYSEDLKSKTLTNI